MYNLAAQNENIDLIVGTLGGPFGLRGFFGFYRVHVMVLQCVVLCGTSFNVLFISYITDFYGSNQTFASEFHLHPLPFRSTI